MKQPMHKFVYRIRNKKTGRLEGAYSRAYSTQYDFESPEQARHSNCHGVYEDENLYDIIKYEVIEIEL